MSRKKTKKSRPRGGKKHRRRAPVAPEIEVAEQDDAATIMAMLGLDTTSVSLKLATLPPQRVDDRIDLYTNNAFRFETELPTRVRVTITDHTKELAPIGSERQCSEPGSLNTSLSTICKEVVGVILDDS